jgi:hypothetical protein
MKNVRLHADEGIVLEVRHLRGEMISRDAGRPPIFDDQRSYTLRVHAAEVAMDMPSLTNLMNHHVFAFENAPLSDIAVEIDEGQLKLKGKLHKGVTVPISMKADVVATPDGRMRLKTDKVSALGVPAKKLMDLFGLQLDEIVSLKERRGIEIQDNDVIIAPGQVLPPPEIQGRLSRVAIVNGRLQQTFVSPAGASAPKLSPPDPASPNYVYFSGSDIRFGRLTMSGADLQLAEQLRRVGVEVSSRLAERSRHASGAVRPDPHVSARSSAIPLDAARFAGHSPAGAHRARGAAALRRDRPSGSTRDADRIRPAFPAAHAADTAARAAARNSAAGQSRGSPSRCRNDPRPREGPPAGRRAVRPTHRRSPGDVGPSA